MTKTLLETMEYYNNDLYSVEDLKRQSNAVIWSGGCDSTLLLYEMAVKYGTKDSPVYAVSAIYDGIIQYKQEIKARKELKKFFKQQKLHIKYIDVKYDYKYSHKKELKWDHGGLKQALLWLCMCNYLYNTEVNVLFGYVRGDDIWHYKQYFVDAFENLSRMVQSKCTLQLPYEYAPKSHIIEMLIEYDLLDKVWYCDRSTDDKPCGECHKCVGVNRELLEIERVKQRDFMIEQAKKEQYQTCIDKVSETTIERQLETV